MAEWLKAPVLKTGRRESVSWVRIPPPPPDGFCNLLNILDYFPASIKRSHIFSHIYAVFALQTSAHPHDHPRTIADAPMHSVRGWCYHSSPWSARFAGRLSPDRYRASGDHTRGTCECRRLNYDSCFAKSFARRANALTSDINNRCS